MMSEDTTFLRGYAEGNSEQAFATLVQAMSNQTDSDAWSQTAPLLDQALDCLRKMEHDAIILRFFEGKELKQVGAAMGVGEDTTPCLLPRHCALAELSV